MSEDNYTRPLTEREVAVLNGVALRGLAEGLEERGEYSIATSRLMELAESMIKRANKIDAAEAEAE